MSVVYGEDADVVTNGIDSHNTTASYVYTTHITTQWPVCYDGAAYVEKSLEQEIDVDS